MPIVCGVMVPHPPIAIPEIGGDEVNRIRDTLDSYDRIARKIEEIRPDTIILTSPHSVMYSDYFHISPGKGERGDLSRFRHPELSFDVSYDEEFTDALSERAMKIGMPAGTDGAGRNPLLNDHGTMVPLYFINRRYRDYKLVRIGLSGLSLEIHECFGRMIRSVADECFPQKKIVFVASGDLSHCQKEDGPYGYKAAGPRYDEKLMEVMGRGALSELKEFDEDLLGEAEECGHRSFTIMAGVFHKEKIHPEILSHEATFGVGYGFGIFEPEPSASGDEIDKTETKEKNATDPYVELAVSTVNAYIRGGRPEEFRDALIAKAPEEMLEKRAGAFVSIHECGMLRGCIGTIGPTCDNLAEEILQNAISASTKDPRFTPVTEEELPSLEISVDVLDEPEAVDSPSELDVKRYGVIVESGYKRGLLLPNLDGVDTIEEQIAIAKRKAGIREGEKVSLKRFEVVRHE
ncbi:MAG: AmmeMemoRadiSam system protein A [Lachnospiraceae bacterium]|nr:AmmeMemoRadiSam system protein A [Lachnospiraceae bacterium]